MSVDAGLCVHLRELRFADIVDCYMKSGLDAFDDKRRAYVIVSEDDSFDWEHLSAAYEELCDFFDNRQKNGFPAGIALYENGETVTCIFAENSEELIIGCDTNRKVLEKNGAVFTDANWYIEKFVVPLKNAGFAVEGFKFWEWQ